jgi:hypothetical protein
VLLTGVPSAPAQFMRDHEVEGGVRGFHGVRGGKITRSFQSDAEADAEFKRILSAVGLGYVTDRITLRATSQTPNAEAFIDDKTGERFIFYNASFMQRVKERAAEDWSPISILAHEVGHHLAFHTAIAGNDQKYELEADYFSGFVLRRLGATLDQAQAAMRVISPKTPGLTHPGLDDRLQAITIGWKDGGAPGTPPGLKEAKRPTGAAQEVAVARPSPKAEPSQNMADVATCAESYRKLAAVRTDVSGQAILGMNGGSSNLSAADEGLVLRMVGSLPSDCSQAARNAGPAGAFLPAITAAIHGLRTDVAGAVIQIVKGRGGNLTLEQLGTINRYIADTGRDPSRRLPDAPHVSLLAALTKSVRAGP